ncbi:hypothetical protein CJ030_MR7G013482 [Morella rubra]|uniref:Uncharacterized protein n=1 Tax=Morella rubra TaxID=262757 RepID=A0A6A1V2D7_9ROSI|nr:hypothetical protein CJ030_MR7G013482 [Morella rubra]
MRSDTEGSSCHQEQWGGHLLVWKCIQVPPVLGCPAIDIQEKTTEVHVALIISSGKSSNLQAQVITRGFRNNLEQIVAERRASPTAQDDILAEHLGNGRTKFHLNDELDT